MNPEYRRSVVLGLIAAILVGFLAGMKWQQTISDAYRYPASPDTITVVLESPAINTASMGPVQESWVPDNYHWESKYSNGKHQFVMYMESGKAYKLYPRKMVAVTDERFMQPSVISLDFTDTPAGKIAYVTISKDREYTLEIR